jgi:hypothetical protein
MREVWARPIRRDIFSTFVAELRRERPTRIWLVSPWLSRDVGGEALDQLVAHAARHDAPVHVVTRRPASEAHAEAIGAVTSLRRSHVSYSPAVHAKLYVCESGGRRGFAVVGSANMTVGADALDEFALLVRPRRDSALVRDLLIAATSLKAGAESVHRGTREELI